MDSTEARKCMRSLTHVWFTVTKTVSRVHVLELIYIARTLQCINQSSGDEGDSVVERQSPRAHCDRNWSRVRFRAARGELVFFSRVNFLCFLLACSRCWSFCQKPGGWLLLNTCTLRNVAASNEATLWCKLVHVCMVYTERAPRRRHSFHVTLTPFTSCPIPQCCPLS